MTLKISLRELIFSIFLFMLPLSLFLETKTDLAVISYVDEALCILCVFYTIIFSLRRGIKGTDLALIIFLIICSVIGLLGNMKQKLMTDFMPIAVDLICLVKVFIVFLVYKQIAQYDKKHYMAIYLAPAAKLMLLTGTLFGLISQFVNIGMTTKTRRYGILPYHFIFENEGRYAFIIACCMLILLICKLPRQKEVIYEVLMAINIILTTKGVGYIVLACYIILVIIWRRSMKIDIKTLIALIVAGIGGGYFQINKYLKDSEAPRVILIKYGFETAKRYFPLGSGFATYGSDMAARNYSKLYYYYRFNKLYGLSPKQNFFLNDCYMGMIAGQFGYIGLVVFGIMVALLFVPIAKMKTTKKIKALTLALFIGLFASSIATAIIKSSIGVFVLGILGMSCGYAFAPRNNTKEDLQNISTKHKEVKQ